MATWSYEFDAALSGQKQPTVKKFLITGLKKHKLFVRVETKQILQNKTEPFMNTQHTHALINFDVLNDKGHPHSASMSISLAHLIA